MTEQSELTVPTWNVSDRLRKALTEAGVGVAEMADYLEVSRTSVGNWINGRVRPDTRTMRVWAMRCGVPYEWLRDGTESVPSRELLPHLDSNQKPFDCWLVAA